MNTDAPAPTTDSALAQEWAQTSEEFRTKNFTLITEGVMALLTELTARVNQYLDGDRLTSNSYDLLHRLRAEPLSLNGVTYNTFWLSKLQVRPHTSNTTVIATELVIGAGEHFVDVEFYAGYSDGMAALKLSNELRSTPRR